MYRIVDRDEAIRSAAIQHEDEQLTAEMRLLRQTIAMQSRELQKASEELKTLEDRCIQSKPQG